MNKRQFLSLGASVAIVGAFGGCSTTGPNDSVDPASKRRTIDAKVDESIGELGRQAPEARELMGRAKGVLVLPTVVSAGFIVGGSYGEGALRKGGRSIGYYSTKAGSVGLLAGAQSKSVFLLFMTQESLDKFVSSEGWTAGVDASVAVMKVGADANVDTKSITAPVISYVMSGGGLMANLSFDGTKFSKLDI